MIDFKKLHGDFLMHQALLTAAVVANNPIQQVSPTSSSLSPKHGNNNERKQQQQQQIENSSFNDTSYDCPSSMSSLCSSSPNDLSPSSVVVEDKLCKNKEISSNDENYQVVVKRLKTEHRNENFSHQTINEPSSNIQLSEESRQTEDDDSKAEKQQQQQQHSAENSAAASPLSIAVHSSISSTGINFSPIGNITATNKRKFSDFEPSSILSDNTNNSNIVNEQKDGNNDLNKSLKSSIVGKQKFKNTSSSISSISSSSPFSNNSSSTYSPLSYTQSLSSKPNNHNTKSSFMISDILGLDNNNISSSQFDATTTQLNNEQLFQQCQIHLQHAFPYLTNLTSNQSDLFKLIASTLAIEQQNKYLSAASSVSNLSSDIPDNLFSKTYNNHMAISSTPILTSPTKSNSSKHVNMMNNANTPISFQTKVASNAVNNHNSRQSNVNSIEKKPPPTSTANLILSSLEQLTYNQFKDYSSTSSRKNENDTNLSKKLSSCTPNSSASQLSPLSSLSSLSTSSSSASSLSSISSSLISTKNPNKMIESRSSSTDQVNRKSVSKNDVLETTSTSNINKSANEQNGNLWPAWVYCTRYSDRPSAGPRHRKKNKKVPSSLNTSSGSNSNKGSISTEPSLYSTNENSRQLANKFEQHSSQAKSFKHDDDNQINVSKKNSDMTYLSSIATKNSSINSNNSIYTNSSNTDTNATNLSKKVAYNSKNYLNYSKYTNNNDVETRVDEESSSSMFFSNENEYIEEDSRPPSEEDNYYDKSNAKSDLNDRQVNDNNINRNLDDDDEYYSDNDSDSSHSKRPRTAFTGSQLNRLKHEFEKCKYLTGEKRQYLANELKLNESQIKIWFQNKRAKIKKSSGVKNNLALQLMAQGLYNHGSNKNDEENYSD